MKNDLSSLNDYLFEELERLNDDEELEGEKLEKELKRAKAIGNISTAIVNNAKVILDARKFAEENGDASTNEVLKLRIVLMIRKWDSEKIEYLKQICPGRNEKEIADMINKKFNTTFTKSAINSIKRKYNIRSKKVVRVYTDEVVEFIINNYQGKDNIELAELVNKQFNLNINSDSICNFKGNIKRRKGINLNTGINRGCIKKGNIPMNKGKKWSEYMSEEGMKKSSKTWYKKGNISSNADPIGTEKIKYSKSNKDDGYICIKVCDGKKQKNWIPKHRLIYEQHYGKIPAGHKVIFADGNKENFDIDNLILVKNSEELIMNRRKLIFDNKELTKTGANIAKVLNKAYERQKGL